MLIGFKRYIDYDEQVRAFGTHVYTSLRKNPMQPNACRQRGEARVAGEFVLAEMFIGEETLNTALS